MGSRLHPFWWSPTGHDAKLKLIDLPSHTLIIEVKRDGDVLSEVEVTRAHPAQGHFWRGQHKVKVTNTLKKREGCRRDTKSWLRIPLEHQHLLWMLQDMPPIGHHPGDLEAQWKADIVYPGEFIRQGPYLNIGDPGTGVHPSVSTSIFLYRDIIQAGQELLARVGKW